MSTFCGYAITCVDLTLTYCGASNMWTDGPVWCSIRIGRLSLPHFLIEFRKRRLIQNRFLLLMLGFVMFIELCLIVY